MSAKGQGAVGQMREWFQRNPGELLEYPDLVKKFGFRSAHAARQAVYVLKMEGVLKSGFVVYTDPERPRLPIEGKA